MALSGILGALMFVSQVVLAPLPNVELASSLTVLFTLALGPYVGYTLAVFVLLEGVAVRFWAVVVFVPLYLGDFGRRRLAVS